MCSSEEDSCQESGSGSGWGEMEITGDIDMSQSVLASLSTQAIIINSICLYTAGGNAYIAADEYIVASILLYCEVKAKSAFCTLHMCVPPPHHPAYDNRTIAVQLFLVVYLFSQ